MSGGVAARFDSSASPSVVIRNDSGPIRAAASSDSMSSSRSRRYVVYTWPTVQAPRGSRLELLAQLQPVLRPLTHKASRAWRTLTAIHPQVSLTQYPTGWGSLCASSVRRNP